MADNINLENTSLDGLSYRELQTVAIKHCIPANLKKSLLCTLIELTRAGKTSEATRILDDYRKQRCRNKDKSLNNYVCDANTNMKTRYKKKKDKEYCKQQDESLECTLLENNASNIIESLTDYRLQTPRYENMYSSTQKHHQIRPFENMRYSPYYNNQRSLMSPPSLLQTMPHPPPPPPLIPISHPQLTPYTQSHVATTKALPSAPLPPLTHFSLLKPPKSQSVMHSSVQRSLLSAQHSEHQSSGVGHEREQTTILGSTPLHYPPNLYSHSSLPFVSPSNTFSRSLPFPPPPPNTPFTSVPYLTMELQQSMFKEQLYNKMCVLKERNPNSTFSLYNHYNGNYSDSNSNYDSHFDNDTNYNQNHVDYNHYNTNHGKNDLLNNFSSSLVPYSNNVRSTLSCSEHQPKENQLHELNRNGFPQIKSRNFEPSITSSIADFSGIINHNMVSGGNVAVTQQNQQCGDINYDSYQMMPIDGCRKEQQLEQYSQTTSKALPSSSDDNNSNNNTRTNQYADGPILEGNNCISYGHPEHNTSLTEASPACVSTSASVSATTCDSNNQSNMLVLSSSAKSGSLSVWGSNGILNCISSADDGTSNFESAFEYLFNSNGESNSEINNNNKNNNSLSPPNISSTLIQNNNLTFPQVYNYVASTEVQQIQTVNSVNEKSIAEEENSSINYITSVTDVQQVGTSILLQNNSETCRYEGLGCTEVFQEARNVMQHEKTCKYQPTQCPVDFCNWQSNLNSLPIHITEAHSANITSEATASFILPLPKVRNTPRIQFFQIIENHVFITTVARIDHLVYTVIQYVKNGDEDLNSRGLLKILDKNFIPWIWEGKIKPYYDSQTMNLRSQGHSLVFDLFSSPDFSFTLDVAIDVVP